MSNKVCYLYQAKIAKGELEPNIWQQEMVNKYDLLLTDILNIEQTSSTSLFSRIFNKKSHINLQIKGYYVYGKVGRGKTMLMDLFYEALPIESKMRIHFNDFMQYVQTRLNFYRSEAKNQNTIELVAQEIYKKAKILCFDEFSVTDIADAMILARLFKFLFEKGIVLIATSNVAPQDLYKNGLNRDLFLPFIPLLEQNCHIIDTAIDKDFRMQKTSNNFYYLYPINNENSQIFEKEWVKICDNKKQANKVLEVKGHKIYIKNYCDKAVYFTFNELCVAALGVNDYNIIVKNFDTVFIKDISYFNDEMINWAKRFILLIDIFYEHNIRLFILASDKAENLYKGIADKPEKFEFIRTSSRLFEMQSIEYLKNWQKRYKKA